MGTDIVDPFEAVLNSDRVELIRWILARLSPREEKMIRMRFGIGYKPHTLEDIAEHFLITRERSRQIILKVLRRLRHTTVSNWLKECV